MAEAEGSESSASEEVEKDESATDGEVKEKEEL